MEVIFLYLRFFAGLIVCRQMVGVRRHTMFLQSPCGYACDDGERSASGTLSPQPIMSDAHCARFRRNVMLEGCIGYYDQD
jgi:hypothetical protein